MTGLPSSAKYGIDSMRCFTIFYRVTLALSVLMFYGCSGYAPRAAMLGSDVSEVVRILGTPSNELATPEGKILVFPRGPFGKHTYFVYLDQNNRMERWTQVLLETNFDRIKPGMTRQEVIALIGESKIRDGLAFGRGYVWSWRYVNSSCLWFRVEFSPEDMVRSTLYQKPPECRARIATGAS